MLYLVQGPAGGGKSQLAREMLAAGEIQVLADITQLWVALSGVQRGPDGRYPVRDVDDPALQLALYLQEVAVNRALDLDYDVAATTSRRGQEERWQERAQRAGRAFAVRTVDPGLAVVTRRLAESTGVLSDECARAIGRWYG